jgi:hypothetical protein
MKLKHDVRVLEMMTNHYSQTDCRLSEAYISDGNNEWERDNLSPDTRYAVLMVPIPDGYKLSHKPEDGALTLDREVHRSRFDTVQAVWCSGNGMMDNSIYIVPTKSERDKRRYAVEARIKAAEAELKKAREELSSI